jgi:hypothetical protein
VELFGRLVALDGSVYFCAEDDFLRRVLNALKVTRKIPDGVDVTWADLVTLPLKGRLDEAEALRFKGLWAACGTVNILQSVFFKGGPSKLAPCLTRKSSCLWDSKQDRPQLAEEALIQMGIPAFRFLSEASGYKCVFEEALTGEARPSDGLLRSVAGNGMHLGTFGAAFLSLISGMKAPLALVLPQPQILSILNSTHDPTL